MLKILKFNLVTKWLEYRHSRSPIRAVKSSNFKKNNTEVKLCWADSLLANQDMTMIPVGDFPESPLRRDEVIQIKEKFYRFFTKYYLVWSVTEKANCEATTLFWFYMDSLVFRPLNQSYSLLKKQLNYLCLREPSCSRTVSTGTVPDPPGWSFHVLPMCVWVFTRSGFIPQFIQFGV